MESRIAMKSARTRTVVCTIISKNYLSFARTLMDSVRGTPGVVAAGSSCR